MTNSENMGTGVPEEGKEPVGAHAQPASASSSEQPIENYQTVDEQLDAQSATGQLQDMIHSDGFHPERYDDPEVEIAADRANRLVHRRHRRRACCRDRRLGFGCPG